ncbi:MAG: hypothetical protein GY851_28900, partial [bacterium]|nr:hypothetical protein [bacterium]
ARTLEDPAPIQFGTSVIDEGPSFDNPAHRFKFGWWKDGGLKVASSPDGITWTPMTADPVIHHNHDITGIFRDAARNRYIATLSVYRGGPWEGNRRITMQSASQDFVHWERPHYVVLPDLDIDPGVTQFYAMDGYLARGDLLIGMVKVLRDDLKADDPPDPPEAYGVGHTALAWSRDGETWTRDTVHFFDPHPEQGVWDHAHAWIDDQVLVDDEVYLYYGGYARGHKVNRFEERQIGLVTMKRDRYVAREADGDTGLIRTPLVRLDGEAITVNADCRAGVLAVQVSDDAGAPLPGLSFDDCDPISEDGVDLPVRWKAGLGEARQHPVRIEFRLRNARLFAFGLG